ncbi:hypothetical protein C8J56DRAFT_972887, partial [Mycena floridula]
TPLAFKLYLASISAINPYIFARPLPCLSPHDNDPTLPARRTSVHTAIATLRSVKQKLVHTGLKLPMNSHC